MRWTHKARIQRACAAVPRGDVLYQRIQRRFGALDADPFTRLPRHAALLRQLVDLGFNPVGARCVEVGTGHLPVAPVACWLAGATEVVTVDLHRRLAYDLTARMLHHLVTAEDRLVRLYAGTVDAGPLRDRLTLLRGLADRPADFFAEAGIRYVAPGDAARLPDADGTVDLHLSITVLEHVEPTALRGILTEARRVLRPDGFAAHLIDPSDHFAHQDGRITKVNFLRFSARRWRRLGGNEFAYCNRLRASELERMFADTGFAVQHCHRTVDDRSLAAVRDGFPLHRDFRGFDAVDLCTTGLDVYARPLATTAAMSRPPMTAHPAV